MATLTLGKSVTTDAVRSKKGDAVFVERRRRVVAPGSKELRDEPNTPATQKNAADEKLRAVLAAAKAREEERKKREAEEEARALRRRLHPHLEEGHGHHRPRRDHRDLRLVAKPIRLNMKKRLVRGAFFFC